MGTRAAFWIGDPRDLENRLWIGCVAWDGYPSGLPQLTQSIPTTEEEFLSAVKRISEQRDDFADPKNGGWPYPWTGDIFLTDYTYAFFNGKVQVTHYHAGFVPLEKYDIKENEYSTEEMEERGETGADDPSLVDVPFEGTWDRNQPDSIILLGERKDE